MTIYRSQCTFRLLGKTAKYEQEVNELKQELSTIRYFFIHYLLLNIHYHALKVNRRGYIEHVEDIQNSEVRIN